MHHFVVKFSKIFFASGGKRALTPKENPADISDHKYTVTSDNIRQNSSKKCAKFISESPCMN